MTFFRREADRLDTYLDDQLAGRSVDPDDVDPALIETWTWAQTAMAHTPSDPTAKSETWRTLMQAHAIAAPPLATVPNPPARRYDELNKPRWSTRALALAGTAALAAGLAVGVVGYGRFGGGNVPSEPTSIPAASFFLPGTPTAIGCDVPRREPGAIEQTMQTPPSQMAYFPRVNSNPLIDPIAGSGNLGAVVDGTALWTNSSPDDTHQAEIQAMLETLYDCRSFAIGSDGRIDMEGAYFSNYSDDYFRRELNGFTEAGLPLEINTFWLPTTKPEITEIRKLMDGNRYLVVLDEQGESGTTRVLSVVPGDDGAWYVDEVGNMTQPQIDAAGTPIVDQEEISARATEYAATPVTDRYPHELTVSVADLAVANEDTLTCDMQNGTPIPCSGMGIQRIGPWTYNEIPANTPFTFTFVNSSDAPTRIIAPALGIDVTLLADEQVDVEVDADPGEYIVEFRQADATSSWTFQFEPADGRFTMG